MMTISTLRQTRPALAAFFVMGILWGSFSADLPDIKTMLAVDESRLGFLMFLTPLAAMLAMRAAPWMSEQLGRSVLGVTTVCMALAFILPGQTGVWYLFPAAMLVCGATTGAVDVLMNARVSAMEVAQGRPLMNLCHAAYSFGYAGGAWLWLLRQLCQPCWPLPPLKKTERSTGLTRHPKGPAPTLA